MNPRVNAPPSSIVTSPIGVEKSGTVFESRRMLDYDVAPQGDRLHRVVLECECASEAKRFKHEVLQQIGTDARFDIQPLEGALGIRGR